MYLTAAQLSELTDLKPNQRAAIRRWLIKNNWVFTVSATGFPQVLTRYHDGRMMGEIGASQAKAAEIEPNFGALRK
jgi:hypothetical protein